MLPRENTEVEASAVAFTFAGAVLSAIVGALANWITRPKWTERHPGRVITTIAAFALVGAMVTVTAQQFADARTDSTSPLAPGGTPASAPATAGPPVVSVGPQATLSTGTDGSGSNNGSAGLPQDPGSGGGVPVVTDDPPPQPTSPRVVTKSLPVVEVGVSWTVDLTASGGTPAYRWAVSAGALPSGFVLQPSGQINGIARSTRERTFTVVVTDRMGATATKEFTIKPRPTRSDLNEDGPVDCADKAILQSQWNQSGPALSADLNHDEVVNITDLSIMMSDWTGDSGSC